MSRTTPPGVRWDADLAALGEAMSPAWDSRRAVKVREKLEHRQRRAVLAKAGSSAVLCAIAVGFGLQYSLDEQPSKLSRAASAESTVGLSSEFQVASADFAGSTSQSKAPAIAAAAAQSEQISPVHRDRGAALPASTKRDVVPSAPSLSARSAADSAALVRPSPAPMSPSPDPVGELLLAADATVARSISDPSVSLLDAVASLERVVKRYPSDSRAPLAAFTAGRLLQEQLRQPLAAGRSFMMARVLAPRGPLAEDALLRELECSAQAGQWVRGKELAHEVMRRFGGGNDQRLSARDRQHLHTMLSAETAPEAGTR